jgi:hypothetical protein
MNYDDTETQAAVETVRMAKLQKKLIELSWTSELESLVQSWGEKAAVYRELHSIAATDWRTQSNRMYLPSIVLSTISGFATVGAAGQMHTGAISVFWMYCIGTVNLSAGILTSVIKMYRPDEKSTAHVHAAKTYAAFVRNVSLQLSLSRGDRQAANTLTEWAKDQYSAIQKEAPLISKSVIRRFLSENPDVKTLPDMISGDYSIKIAVVDPETRP